MQTPPWNEQIVHNLFPCRISLLQLFSAECSSGEIELPLHVHSVQLEPRKHDICQVQRVFSHFECKTESFLKSDYHIEGFVI